MSQRGPLTIRATQNTSAFWWTSIRYALVFMLTLTIGVTPLLNAQEAQQVTVTLRMGGSERKVVTSKTTVQTLLHQEHICLNEHDRCEPPITEAVTDGMVVTVTRITCETVVQRSEFPAPVVTQQDARIRKGLTFVTSEGSAGIQEDTTIIWKKDGQVSAQWVQSTRIVKHSRPRVIIEGIGEYGSRMAVRKIMTVESTAYDPGPLSCGANCTGRTATGMKATKGVIAVDPRVIPLGTRVFVDGYGYAIAADTGGAIKGNRIDVCFDTRQEALNWGRRTVQVMILE